MNANDIEMALRARAAFSDSVERIDADTRRRLRDIRLHAQRSESRHKSARWMWPAGAAVTAALALAIFLPDLHQAPTTALPTSTAVVATPQHAAATSTARDGSASVAQAATPDLTELPTLETADPDMLSDLDFYGWLAKQPGSGNPGG
jgi:hypothetical protein